MPPLTAMLGGEARQAVGADGGADKRNGHAEAGCVVNETRVLGMLIELLEVPLKGTVAEPVWRCAVGANGGASDLVKGADGAETCFGLLRNDGDGDARRLGWGTRRFHLCGPRDRRRPPSPGR